MNKYVIGLDFGTDSCRALVVDATTGTEIATSVQYYRRWKEGRYCEPTKNRYRQHPLDYLEALEGAVKEALQKSPAGTADAVVGLSLDTTGSTPVLLDRSGTPLALTPELADNPNAMFILWKDHTAIDEAMHINRLSKAGPIDYTMYEGGTYSPEWAWAKAAHVLNNDAAIRAAAYSWTEHCDWMSAVLTGNTRPENIVRSRCAAGHKAMWHQSWGGLPSEEFLATVSVHLKGFRSRLYTNTFTSDTRAGFLSQEWAERLGLTTNVAIGVGALDCHFGAVGAGITEGAFVSIIGTSTCDIMVASTNGPNDILIPGICGQVDGSVIPGMHGFEAGQSAFGDVYAWFRRLLEFPLSMLDNETLRTTIADRIIPELTTAAEKIPAGESALLATDWLNGRRSPDANPLLTGSISGLTLGTSAPHIFRALVEATAFGARAIIERFREHGTKIHEVLAVGGVAQKSPFVMQTLADVLEMPVNVSAAEQSCALGAAMFAAVVAGICPDIQHAQQAMGQGFSHEYSPTPSRSHTYRILYQKYLKSV
ncbi:MAG: ribulokinase [Bacteroidales bacterium]|jgi:L-ribulokinase|nr:ribulokinase [Bacteroidales bacterium]